MNNYESNNVILIMAGGLGKRMNSELPKVLHIVNNKPMIVHIIENSFKINPFKILLIVGKYKDIIENTINLYINENIKQHIDYIIQEEPLGTGHAIMCAKKTLKTMRKKNVLILSGDTPLVDDNLINLMLNDLINFKICTTCLEKPYGYGRIIEYEYYTKIVEQKDCNENEININLVNCGIYAFKIEILLTYINLLNNYNKQNEYYLTDIIEIISKKENFNVEILQINSNDNYKVLGVNTKEQLTEIENILNNKSINNECFDNFTMY